MKKNDKINARCIDGGCTRNATYEIIITEIFSNSISGHYSVKSYPSGEVNPDFQGVTADAAIGSFPFKDYEFYNVILPPNS